MTSENEWGRALDKVCASRAALKTHVEALKHAALIERQVWAARVEAGRNDALREAADKISVEWAGDDMPIEDVMEHLRRSILTLIKE